MPEIELAAQGVAQLALDIVLGHVAVATVDLDGVLCASYPVLADSKLGKRGIEESALTLAV